MTRAGITLREKADLRLTQLDFNLYLGNTVMIGMSRGSNSLVQICWLMGRDETERNRQFEMAEWKQGKFVQTIREAEKGGKSNRYPTMLSYNDTAGHRELHVVTTGNRTRAIIQSMCPDPARDFATHGFGETRGLYEPEADRFATPRVSGLLNIGTGTKNIYGSRETHVNYSLLTDIAHTVHTEQSLRSHTVPGVALAAHSYSSLTGAPDRFEGKPYYLPLVDTADATAEYIRDFWWERLPEQYRVAIAVLAISGSERAYAVRNA